MLLISLGMKATDYTIILGLDNANDGGLYSVGLYDTSWINVASDGYLGNFMIRAKVSLKNHNINISPSEDGLLKASKDKVKFGNLITLSHEPDAGYELDLDSIILNGNLLDQLEFVMPYEDVFITYLNKKILYISI